MIFFLFFLFFSRWEQEPFYILDPERILSYGLNPQKFQTGVVGEGEFSSKVRITAINGILYTHEDCLRSMEIISKAHRGSNVHYVFWNSEGWTEDMFKCLFSKLGYVSEPAIALSNLWKELIAEMGGVEGDGQIYHFAHSIGVTETYIATSLLTPEEQEKLHIITFGGASLIPKGALGSVVNYISFRDGVSLLDPWRYYLAKSGQFENVVFVGEFDAFEPEHTWEEGSYLKIIETYGNNFQESFLKIP